MTITLPALCLVTFVLCNVHGSLEHEIPRRSFLSRRAIDGTRGRKYFDPEEEGAFDSYGSAGGQYDPYQEKTDFSDIRRNVPGEPGVDYPSYTRLPQTGFTCEGRSRGYYADEVSGCQVFHVCHDVLVSSFLCPIGSIFSQKLLTCDWWTKVDCSSSSKYTDVNRNSYQQDDDEMIRNAYAMVSLQSGTDVTKDGLVDPDRTGSIVDYQRGPGRIFDYSPVDTTGNDLRSNFEDYPRSASRDFLPPFHLKERKPETSRSYQEKFYSSEKSRSPYQDSPIIRVQKINDPGYEDHQKSREFQESYRRPNEFTNRFQPSYAPTVPTVTTTTRRFYSPTVPTTFRPSTLAYNKLDQVIDSSDYYFSHSRAKSFVTPPTRALADDNKRGLGGGLGKTEDSRNFNSRDEDYSRQESYEDDYEDSEEARTARSKEKFQVRVPDDLNYNRSRIFGGRGFLFDEVYKEFDRNRDDVEVGDDFETRGSIGLGHALHQSFRGITVQEQNPIKGNPKTGESNSHGDDVNHTLIKPESVDYSEEKKEETTEQYQRNDQSDAKTGKEDLPDASDIFAPSTTPSVIESTIKASTIPQSNEKNSTQTKDSIDRMDSGFQSFGPTEFLKPPQKPHSKFQIKVPDLSDVSKLLIHYSTLADDGPYPGTRTTEMPRFQNTYSDDYVDQPTSFDRDLGVTEREESFQNYPTTVARPLISSSGSSWKLFPTSSPGSVDATIPSEANRGFTEPNHQSHPSFNSKNDPEVLDSQKSGSQLAKGEALQSPNVSTVSAAIVSVSTPKTLRTTQSAGLASATIETSSASLESVTRTSTEEAKEKLEDKLEDVKDAKIEASTANALFKSIRPETLKQIEENIERNNSPYQVTLTVNKDEDVAPTGQDLISKLIAHQGKETSTLSDPLHELEIVKSVEPEIHTTVELEPTTTKSFDVKEHSNSSGDSSNIELDKLKNTSTVSLLQLMSELLKLDRIPRPFSLSDSQPSELRTRSQILYDVLSSAPARTIAKDINSNMELQNEASTGFFESSTEVISRTSVPKSKGEILDQLAENFGEPLYKGNRKSTFDPPGKQRSLDFETGLPLKTTRKLEGLSSVATTVHTTLQASSKLNPTATVSTTTTTTTPASKTTLTTQNTVVKTEFVPSIGFSLNTDEGREEYVEAVLGGLIEPETAESEKKETILKGKAKEETLSKEETPARKNETSAKI